MTEEPWFHIREFKLALQEGVFIQEVNLEGKGIERKYLMK